MRMMDLAPLTRSSIGFDRLFDTIQGATQAEPADSYPNYNIEKTGENAYRITLAVAGFEPDDLSITTQPNQVIVAGRKAQTESGELLYQGIASRSFQRCFNFADYIRVTGANLHHGMLTIELTRLIPEATKPRRIAISSSDGGQIRHRQAA